MSWSRRFRIGEYVRESLWLTPLLGAIIGGLLGAGMLEVDRTVAVPAYWTYSPSTASTVLSAIVGAMAALTGFVVTVTVLVVQMATGTFSARYMRLWYRDRLLKSTLAVLVGTLTFSFGLLRRIESNFVPNLGVTVAGALVVLSLILFLVFFDRFIHRLRPVAVAALVARSGRAAFSETSRLVDRPEIRWDPYESAPEPTLEVRSPRAGSIQAVHANGLVRWADKHDVELVLVRAIGDFVTAGATLIRVYGGVGNPTVAERELQGMVALGDERTIQQDPAFALRIMVDIANKALSAAVNDPTTAVQVLDHLGGMLRVIGNTDLERREKSASGSTPTRVVMRARTWEDYLTLGVTEICEYGASSTQVMRRMRAMLEELQDDVRPEFRSAVSDELVRLDAITEATWSDSVDLGRALVTDGQGIGGPGSTLASRR
jgi:uncharacterized membrane protein